MKNKETEGRRKIPWSDSVKKESPIEQQSPLVPIKPKRNKQVVRKQGMKDVLKDARMEVDKENQVLIVRFNSRPGCMTHVQLTDDISTLLKNIKDATDGYDEAVLEQQENDSPEDSFL